MWVGFNLLRVSGGQLRGWAVLAAALILVAGCSSSRDERAEAAKADKGAAEAGSGDVLAAFEAWANDSGSAGVGDAQASGEKPGSAGASPGNSALDGVIEQFNRKVSTCWKQPFAMPRLATVRLLVQFNPDGTVRNVEPRPEASEALRYRTEAPYLVMIAHTSQALRQCQPYKGIRNNYTRLSRLEMVVDPRMFRD